MTNVFAGVQIEGDERVGIEIVAGADRPVEVGRGVADDEINSLRRQIDRWILPDAAAERLVGVAVLGERRLFRRDVAMLVASSRVGGRPDAHRILGDGVEVPDELAVFGVVCAHKAANPVLAAIGADQDFAVHGGRRHRLAISLLGIGDLHLPDDVAGFRVESVELRIERRDIDLVVINGDAAIVGAAAECRDGAELGLEVPDLLAGLGVERVDVTERRGCVHDPVDDDRRGLQQLLDFGGEDPRRMEMRDVLTVDLIVWIEPGLLVIAVGREEVRTVLRRAVELLLRDRRYRGRRGHRAWRVLDLLRVRHPSRHNRSSADRSKQK